MFVVHNGFLYKTMFAPDDPQTVVPYQQMEDVYAMVVNTFYFTK